MFATRKGKGRLEPAIRDVRGGRRPSALRHAGKCPDKQAPGSVLRIVSTDPHSVHDFQELMKTATKYELLRHEQGRDDWGRRTITYVLRRKT